MTPVMPYMFVRPGRFHIRTITAGDSMASRCLCDGHGPHRKNHGGPCCGVGGGLCVVCLDQAHKACPDCNVEPDEDGWLPYGHDPECKFDAFKPAGGSHG